VLRRVAGTSVGSTFDDVRRALARTLDSSMSLDINSGRQSSVDDGDANSLQGSAAAAAAAAAYPGDQDRQLLRDLQGRSRTSAEGRQTSGPTAGEIPGRQQPQQPRVEVRRVRRQTSDSSVTTPDGCSDSVPLAAAAPTTSTSTGRLNAVHEHFRRDELKRLSLISHSSSLLSSDGTINVVTDSEDDDDQREAVQAKPHPQSPGSQLPSPTDITAASASPSHTSIPTSPSSVTATRSHRQSPRRDVTSAVSSSQPSKCVIPAVLHARMIMLSDVHCDMYIRTRRWDGWHGHVDELCEAGLLNKIIFRTRIETAASFELGHL